MLLLVSTPIGNLEDISIRALQSLREAEVILAEDTRHTGLLLKHFNIPHGPMISFYDEVENAKRQNILETAKNKRVVLVSNAGTPLISDPGYKLAREAIKQGIKVENIPGPCAAITALTVSGLPPDKFLFLGYPPEKESHQKTLFSKLTSLFRNIEVTVIFFVSPHKLLKFLNLLKKTMGDREIVLARELTKLHEEVWRGEISAALSHFSRPQGEFVLLFHLTSKANETNRSN